LGFSDILACFLYLLARMKNKIYDEVYMMRLNPSQLPDLKEKI